MNFFGNFFLMLILLLTFIYIPRYVQAVPSKERKRMSFCCRSNEVLGLNGSDEIRQRSFHFKALSKQFWLFLKAYLKAFYRNEQATLFIMNCYTPQKQFLFRFQEGDRYYMLPIPYTYSSSYFACIQKESCLCSWYLSHIPKRQRSHRCSSGELNQMSKHGLRMDSCNRLFSRIILLLIIIVVLKCSCRTVVLHICAMVGSGVWFSSGAFRRAT